MAWNTWGAFTGVLLTAVLYFVVPERPFMTVHEMRVVGHEVIVTRSIRGNVVADWQVVIVPFDRDDPTCQTKAGPNLHEGWSSYLPSEQQERIFAIDVWVGDEGCFDRLADGDHRMFVTWTPRSDRAPVTAKTTFTKTIQEGP